MLHSFFSLSPHRYTARERQIYVDMSLNELFDDFLSDYSGMSDAILNKCIFMACSIAQEFGEFFRPQKDTLRNH